MSAADIRAATEAAIRMPEVSLLRGDAVKLEPVRFVWLNFIPCGMLTLLAGAGGTGKTTIALALLATITSGGRWPDGTRCTEPGDVVIWSGEDPASVLAARLRAMGADMARVHFIAGMTNTQEGTFDPATDMPLLEEKLRQLPDIRAVLIDPIVSAVSGDSHKNAEVRRGLQSLVDLGRNIGCALIGISHFSKGTDGREPAERVTGSIAFAALARMVLVTAKSRNADDGQADRVLVRAKSNVAPDEGGFSYSLDRVEVADGVEGQRVLWGKRIDGSARELLNNAEGDDSAGSPADAEAFVRGLLADGARPSKEVRKDGEEAGYPWRTLHNAAKRIGVIIRKSGMKGGWTWALPDSPKMPVGPEDAEDASCQGVENRHLRVVPSPVEPDVEVF